MSSGTLVKTQSCYAAIYDEASPANQPNFILTALQAGKRAAQNAGEDEAWGLFYFNDHLIQCVNRGELLAWTLLFNGVYRAVANVLPEMTRAPPLPKDQSDALGLATDLICPTGRLVVACLGDLGRTHTPFMVVEPGTYRISLMCNSVAMDRHEFLESFADYPANDGPDWYFDVQRIAQYEESCS